jgi:hypothetical protein
MEIVTDVYSHMVSITPCASNTTEMPSIPSTPSTPSTPNTPSSELERESSWSDICDGIVPKTDQPVDEGPLSPRRKTRGFFRTCSSNSLHILLNEVVLPVHSVDYMKILPPPSLIYLKTVEGNCLQKHVFMNEEGDRYIIDKNSARVYLQDIKGLYRYNSA